METINEDTEISQLKIAEYGDTIVKMKSRRRSSISALLSCQQQVPLDKIVIECQQKLDKMQSELFQSIQNQFDNENISNSNNLTGSMYYSTGLCEQFTQFDEDLSAALRMCDQSAQNEDYSDQIIQMKQFNDNLLIISKVYSMIQNFNQILELESAAGSIVDIETMLQSLQSDKDNHMSHTQTRIISFLQDAFIDKKAYVISKLKFLISECIKITDCSVTVQIKVKDNIPYRINDVLSAISVLNIEQTIVKGYSNKIVHLIELCFDNCWEIQFDKSCSFTKIKSAKSQDVLLFSVDKLIKFYGYLYESIPDVEDFEFVKELGKMLWDCIFSNFVKIFQTQLSGDSDNEKIQQYLSINNQLQQAKIIPRGDNQMSSYIQNYKEICGKHKFNQVLQNVREIVLCEDENIVEVEQATERGGLSLFQSSKDQSSTKSGKTKSSISSDSTMLLPKMKISVATQTVIEIIYQYWSKVEDSSLSSYEKLEIFHQVRDMIQIWRLNSLHRVSEDQTIKNICIFCNDTTYFVYHLMTMSYQFQKYYAQDSMRLVSLIDLIPSIRKDSSEILINFLMERLNDFDGIFSNIQCVDQLQDKIDYCISKLRLKNMKLLAPYELYGKSIGILIQSLTKQLIECVSNLQDCLKSRTELFKLKCICQEFLQICVELFTIPKAQNGGQGKFLPNNYVESYNDLIIIVSQLL